MTTNVEIQRLSDWRARLIDYLIGHANIPFSYGFNDCALFTAGAVQAMMGVDLARGWRGYRTLAAGRRRLQDRGFADHVALAASALPEIPPAFAAEGDVAAVRNDDGRLVLGIVQGEGIYVMAPTGFGLVPLLSAERAFRV